MDPKKLGRALSAILAGNFRFQPRRRTSTSVALFLAGLGAGVAVGMLFAPMPGEQLRSDVSERAREGFEKVKSKAQEVAAGQKGPSGEVPASSRERNVS